MSIFSRRPVRQHLGHNASSGGVIQDPKSPPDKALRTERFRRSVAARSGNPAFSGRAIARHLGISESIVRRILGGERPLADHHVAALPPSLKEDVEHGTPSERKLLAASGIRRKP